MPAHALPPTTRARRSPHRRRRRLAVAGGLTSAVLALLAVVGNGAAAAATCVGTSCNGQAAAATGCDQDGRVIAGEYIRAEYGPRANGDPIPSEEVFGTLHLYESASCGTVWTVVTRTAGTDQANLRTHISSADDQAFDVTFAFGLWGEATLTSPMWYPAPGTSSIFAYGAIDEDTNLLKEASVRVGR